MTQTFFVVGLEPFNEALLNTIAPGTFHFRELLSYREAVRPPSTKINFRELLDTASARLKAASEEVSGIIGYFDFPTSSLVPTLAHRHGLPGPTLEAVARCEHKYWARNLQREVIPDLLPRYCSVNPFADHPGAQIDLAFPYWIKPVKAHSSYLGFRIDRPGDLDETIPAIRAGIHTLGSAFNEFLKLVDPPPDIKAVDGLHCIAEEIISDGHQCTLEGYVWNGEVVVYGVVDSIRTGQHRSSFSRYQYPTRLPRRVCDRMADAAKAVVKRMDYDGGGFNAEFYWNAKTDKIWLLEINARISKSHSPIFRLVDGVTNQKVLIDLALGRKPDMPRRQGLYRTAAKFMIRRSGNGVVRRIPGAAELARLHEAYPDAMVRILVQEGQHLSQLPFQDSYTYELAELFLGADSHRELLHRYCHCLSLLPFEIEPQAE